MSEPIKRRPFLLRAAFFVFNTVMVLVLISGALLLPGSPLPAHWNPTAPLVISDPVTPVTRLKLLRIANDPSLCLAILSPDQIDFGRMPDFSKDENCHIRERIDLNGVGQSAMSSVETRCMTALRLALWEHHDVQPAARALLDADVTRIRHVGSYNCRQMRLTGGEVGGWSSHATADAIDVTGFDFSDGSRLTLLNDWQGSAFLKQVGQGACRWFPLVLGPEYNALHADHFHLQNTGWGYCR
ncbi:extensin family protein [Aestuariibius sp. HNIBRBA575]|uniref:extensin-like domain-containing protein n=1 Tax=Aestuariibius sp. HNIBRBA575 TaxID=3233343 RepID=UPI0034A45FF5